ncbi:MAG: D-aminoacyl-tRNA deacylase [Defluviitaleaceae bacterium]|nr:D-aminoacyl-tRNA deacylase [Defluviitaleaceae bacterium]
MKIVLQRVNSASVSVDGTVIGEIGKGYVLLLGVGSGDTKEQADHMLAKISKLRIFADENGKTNVNIGDVGGEVLIVSQFTLYADCRKGNRPSFTDAADPLLAEELYNYMVEAAKLLFKKVACGSFGAYMQVELVNDGPFTLVFEG